MTDDPQSTTAWRIGALGEERLGNRLNEFRADSMRVLHDRRIPGTKGNIDHIAVTPTGIYVVDAKRYKGRPTLKIEGGILRPRTEKLVVGSRDCTKLVDDVPQAGRRRPRHRRHRPRDHRCPLLRRSRLAAHRRRLHHPRRRGAVAEEALSAPRHRRPPPCRVATVHERLAAALPPA